MDGYYSLNRYLYEQFGEKVYRLLLDPGTGCPNRDGTLSDIGCTFCKSGNAEFSAVCTYSVSEQIRKAREQIAPKSKAKKFIAYFGVGTATYGDLSTLKKLYAEAVSIPEVVAISLGTRPDYLSLPVIDMLGELNRVKPVWVELGLQTMHDATAKRINRGYITEVYKNAVYRLREKEIKIIPHLIIGLPGESEKDMLSSVRYVCSLPIDGIKLHLLSILRGTPMERQYAEEPWEIPDLESYAHLLCKMISYIPENVVIHRLTGDGAKKDLVAPLWTADKKRVLNTLQKTFSENRLQQGSLCSDKGSSL